MSTAKQDVHVHFDGKVIVPDEPFSFPVNRPFKIRVIPENPVLAEADYANEDDMSPEEQRAALRKLVAMLGDQPEIPLEATRRINMYDDERS